jgi:hypothetical protein
VLLVAPTVIGCAWAGTQAGNTATSAKKIHNRKIRMFKRTPSRRLFVSGSWEEDRHPAAGCQ